MSYSWRSQPNSMVVNTFAISQNLMTSGQQKVLLGKGPFSFHWFGEIAVFGKSPNKKSCKCLLTSVLASKCCSRSQASTFAAPNNFIGRLRSRCDRHDLTLLVFHFTSY